MELTGHIKLIGETQEFGSKGFRKRDLVLTTEGEYPQNILIEFHQDRCDALNAYKPNDAVRIGINIAGREWTNQQGETKWFNTIKGWKIEGASAVSSSSYAPDREEVQPNEDDLPF